MASEWVTCRLRVAHVAHFGHQWWLSMMCTNYFCRDVFDDTGVVVIGARVYFWYLIFFCFPFLFFLSLSALVVCANSFLCLSFLAVGLSLFPLWSLDLRTPLGCQMSIIIQGKGRNAHFVRGRTFFKIFVVPSYNSF